MTAVDEVAVDKIPAWVVFADVHARSRRWAPHGRRRRHDGRRDGWHDGRHDGQGQGKAPRRRRRWHDSAARPVCSRVPEVCRAGATPPPPLLSLPLVLPLSSLSSPSPALFPLLSAAFALPIAILWRHPWPTRYQLAFWVVGRTEASLKKTVQDTSIAPLHQQHASHTLASWAFLRAFFGGRCKGGFDTWSKPCRRGVILL